MSKVNYAKQGAGMSWEQKQLLLSHGGYSSEVYNTSCAGCKYILLDADEYPCCDCSLGTDYYTEEDKE